MIPVEETATLLDDSALGVLCTHLGQIPVGKQPIPNGKFTINWDKFSEVNWEQLICKAQAEGLAPLMYWLLSKSGRFSAIPELARNILRINYYRSWMHNQNIYKELEVLGQAFQKAEIPLIVLKGACLGLTVYPDIGLRPMGDLDILVPGSKISQAIHIAKSFGYYEHFTDEPELSYLNHHICLNKSGSLGIMVELHEALIATKYYKFAVPMDWFWEQTETMDGPTSIRRFNDLLMLTPTAQVLYAATHAMLQHGGKDAPLRWFYDLDRLIRSYEKRLDWDLLLSQAHIFDWGSALDAALFKTVACFDTPIPKQVLTSLSGISDRNQKLVALKQNQPGTHMLMELQESLSLKGFARFRYLLALVVPSPAFMVDRYQVKTFWTIPIYYLIRWKDILKDGFRSLVLFIRQGSSSNRG